MFNFSAYCRTLFSPYKTNQCFQSKLLKVRYSDFFYSSLALSSIGKIQIVKKCKPLKFGYSNPDQSTYIFDTFNTLATKRHKIQAKAT